eukprot:c29540_g1_i1 orf=219-410(+)
MWQRMNLLCYLLCVKFRLLVNLVKCGANRTSLLASLSQGHDNEDSREEHHVQRQLTKATTLQC